MLTILVSLLASVGVAAGLRGSHLVHGWLGLILPMLIAFTVVAMLLLRRATGQLEPLVKEAEKHVMGGRLEMALKTLDGGMRLGAWHPLIPAQLRTLTGSLLFDSGKPKEAEPYLEKALRWPWTSKAMLGVCYFKKREEGPMVKAFEKAVSVGEKESLAWTLYAWCLNACGKKDEAVKVLERGLKKIPGDQRLEANVELVKTGKKMKTAPYGDKWTRFQLESVGPPMPKQARGFALKPGFRQRPLRKKR